MRVHELAKELGVSSKELIADLCDQGLEIKSAMSGLDETVVSLTREKYGSKKASSETKPSKGKTEPSKKKEAPLQSPDKPLEAEVVSEKPAEKEAGKIIKVRGAVIVKDFAEMIGLKPNQLIAELMRLNILASINERIEVNIIRKIAEKHGYVLEYEKKIEEHKSLQKKREIEDEKEEEDHPEDLCPRPPVVTFLGHVDHGKTSLLDKIRNTAVAKGEHGGITQHIGACTVDIHGHTITFLDTPGHAAFTSMRARGANLTDIAVIIIAADDGIMPQTKEAIMHAQAAEVSILIAINKIDLASADLDRVKKQLQDMELAPEDWGGSTICCPVSAETGKGIDHLLEMISLQAEILELKANAGRRAQGYVIESQLEQGMGPTANLLVTNGTLNIGDAIVCGQYWGRVRALINDRGVKVKTVLPATPVKCLGLSGVPRAGESFKVCPNDKTARTFAEETDEELKKLQVAEPKKASLSDLYEQLKDNEKLELKAILKADTQGSVEAIADSLCKIKSDKVSLSIILSGTGNITINDVMLASASNAVVLGFHVSKEVGVDAQVKREGVDIHLYTVIYELIDHVREAMTGLLAPKIEETIMGHVEIKQVFPIGKGKKIAGCLVTDGLITPKFKVRVKRGDEVLSECSILSLKHFKADVSEVKESQECGIRLDIFSAFEEGDILEVYQTKEVTQTL
ncbi:translation initiation factor IF-2 [Verrucomicrobiota bacterium]